MVNQRLAFSAPVLAFAFALACAGCEAPVETSGTPAPAPTAAPTLLPLSPITYTCTASDAGAAAPTTTTYGAAKQDSVFKGDDGKLYYRVAADGSSWPLLARTSPHAAPAAFAPVVPAPKALAPPSEIPPRVLLSETPVKSQIGGSCQTYAAVGAIEAAYLHQYQQTLSLSELYAMLLAESGTEPPYWQAFSGGDMSALTILTGASELGIVPTSVWYPGLTGVAGGAVTGDVQNELLAVFGFDPGTSAGQGAFPSVMNAIWQSQLNLDQANFNTLVSPPAWVHQNAVYGPAEVRPVTAGLNDPATFELLLAEGYEVTIGIDLSHLINGANPGDWVFSSDVDGNGANGNSGGAHEILLVGYDHGLQQFTFKNSWGKGFGNQGYGTISYSYIACVGVYDANYVPVVRDPGLGPLGAGAWRGFWRGSLGGAPGVAVIRNVFLQSSTTASVGAFYADAGTVSDLGQLQSGDLSQLSLGGAGDVKFTLSATGGGASGGAAGVAFQQAVFTEKSTGTSSQWSKCNPSPGAAVSTAQSYEQVSDDPYLLPACGAQL